MRIRHKRFFFLFLFTFSLSHFPSFIFAQELFPNTEPASTIPKGALGLRLMSETYNEYRQMRNQFALRLMYGVSSKLTVFVQPDVSNHHGRLLPVNLLTHTHTSTDPNSPAIYSLNNKMFGLNYPYLFGGFYGYAKYRFLAHDGQQTHFRMAAYLEASTSDAAHDEAEPGLAGDTKGYGGGLIITQLNHRFAASFTGGFVIPAAHNETTIDVLHSYFTTEPVYLHTYLAYGQAAIYNLSVGYLLYPSTSRDYKQTNINVYMELMGASYGGATIIQNGTEVQAQTPTLKKGNYVNAVPGIQAIINSNTRVDFSVAFNLINRSYRYFYPTYLVGLQHYFYL